MTPATSSVVSFEQAGVEFEPVSHTYTYEGERVRNVTGLLRDYRISADWSRVDPVQLEQKRSLGQAVHAATHYADEGSLLASSVAPAVEPYLAAWALAKRELDIEILLIETRLVHSTRRYGGTVDRLGIVHALQRPEWGGDLRPSIVDIKTGDPEDAGAGPQTAAYEQVLRGVVDANALNREDLILGWFKSWDRYSIQLLPTGRYKVTRYSLAADLHRFNWALSLDATAHPSWRKA